MVEISLNLSKIIYQPIFFILPTFASGIKKQRSGFKVLRSNANLAQSKGYYIKILRIMTQINNKETMVKVTRVNGVSQTMDETDYSLVEQYMLDQIEEDQMLEAEATEAGEESNKSIDEQPTEKIEEPTEFPVEPTMVEPQESLIIEEPTEEVVTEQPTTSEVTPPFQADVSLDVAEEIFSALKKRPTSAVVKVKILDGYLVIKVIITFNYKITREYETFADQLLLSLIMRGMRGISVSMDNYGRNPHILEYTVADPRNELLRLFLESPLKCRISPEYVSRDGSGTICLCAEFTIADRMKFQFCLEKTDAVNEIINNAIA